MNTIIYIGFTSVNPIDFTYFRELNSFNSQKNKADILLYIYIIMVKHKLKKIYNKIMGSEDLYGTLLELMNENPSQGKGWYMVYRNIYKITYDIAEGTFYVYHDMDKMNTDGELVVGNLMEDGDIFSRYGGQASDSYTNEEKIVKLLKRILIGRFKLE